MRSVIITGFNNVLKAPRDWDAAKYGPILDLHICALKTIDGINKMSSVWLPDSNDLALLQVGCPIRLDILGMQHPPVLVSVGAITDLAILAAKEAGRA
jgi:hypothetical protein